ncbi:hypothetical protein BLNAU_12690 [Blattamonas nauphoetae]|uniref:Uncharacterized protein n=1 Tax=Blattamonas nauphoetae TaxID=2049346 RepID=A0ABQ9XM86_9EUKA|nr:hypothetical protein BLNAU_12690 [Blattamonas nauphoetae]
MCQCFVDSDHPHGTTSIFFKLLNFLFIVVSVFVGILGIFYFIGIQKFSVFGLILIAMMVVMFLMAVIGNVGSGYGASRKKNRLSFLIAYYIYAILVILFFFAIILCIFLVTTKSEIFMISKWHYIQTLITSAPTWLAWLGTLLSFLNNIYVIGYVCIGIEVVYILSFALTCRLLSVEYFAHVTTVNCSIVVISLATTLIVTFSFQYSVPTLIANLHWVYLVAIGVCALLILLCILGIVASCLRKNTRCPITFFAVSLIITIVALLVVLIVVFIFHNKIRNVTDGVVAKECASNWTACLRDHLDDAYSTTCDTRYLTFFECDDGIPGNVTEGKRECSCKDFDTVTGVPETVRPEYLELYAYVKFKNELKFVGVLAATGCVALFLMFATSTLQCAKLSRVQIEEEKERKMEEEREIEEEYELHRRRQEVEAQSNEHSRQRKAHHSTNVVSEYG